MRRAAGALAVAALATCIRGALADAQPPPRGTVVGSVRDSLAAAPLPGAIVQLAPASNLVDVRTTVADSLGRFRFDTLPPGRYVAAFIHPAVIALGLDLPARAVDVASGAVSPLDLALPGGATLYRAYCGAARADSSGAIAGVVRDAESDYPHGGAIVSASWREVRIGVGAVHTVTRRAPVRVAAGGIFVLCGLPSDVELMLRADAPGWTSGDVAVRAPTGAVARMDVALGEVQAVGARVAGTVRDARGRPLAGATVVVLGTDAHVTTASGGTFRLDRLPDGSWTLEARAIGYEPARVPVVLAQRADAVATLVLDRRAAALDRVVVHGRAPESPATIGFLARRRTNIGGAFLGPSELADRQARTVTDMLRSVRGVQVRPGTSGFGAVVRGRGDCRPDVFVDGMLAQGGADVIDDLVAPNDLLAVEVYAGPGGTPPEFVPPLGGECGAVVLWTKR